MNERQNKFCLEYLKDFNGTKAAIRAGYKENTAAVTSSKLLRKANIKKMIDENIKRQEKKADVTIKAIINGFYEIAFGDEKTSDRLKALEMLGKYLGIFKESEQKATVINVVNRIRG